MTKAVLVYKKSMYQIYFLERNHPLPKSTVFGKADIARLKTSHEIHLRTLDAVRQILRDRKIKFREVYRARQVTYDEDETIISVGGDGTFLEASKKIKDQIILGVNSVPDRSIGNFCPANVNNIEEFLNAIDSGARKVQKIHRLSLVLNDKPVDISVINDLLIAHLHPAAMSRYLITIGDVSEEHRGSGLWLCTAAGATGAIASAGGKPMRIGSKRIQYLPRELFTGGERKYHLRGGVIPFIGPIYVESRMREGMIYIDGSHLRIPFGHGMRLEIARAEYPLRMIVGQG